MKRFDRLFKASIALFVYHVNRCSKEELINNHYLSPELIDKALETIDQVADWNYATARLKLRSLQRTENLQIA